jgi:predicted RNA-binding protein YlxR (DUF448 family)
MRTCIACRRVGSKRDLVRVVRTREQAVQIDPTGKAPGRGAYLCRSRHCWDRALQASLLNSALTISLRAEDLDLLRSFAESLPDAQEVSADPEEQS